MLEFCCILDKYSKNQNLNLKNPIEMKYFLASTCSKEYVELYKSY
jgi:hypothetical protein